MNQEHPYIEPQKSGEVPSVITPEAAAGSERGARSQRSLLLERDLRLRNKKYAAAIAETRSRIQTLESEKARLTEQLVNADDRWTRTQFNDAGMELENARNLVRACEERIAANDAAIAELTPNPEQLQARQERQQRFARLATERLERDQQAYRLIGQLRRILSQRDELTGQMRELAETLELTVTNGGLDEFRFEPLLGALAGALPGDGITECERWHEWFLGKRPHVKTYRVRNDQLTIRETLTDHGIYTLGDPIPFPEGEARELLREDRPAPTEDAPWRLEPPGIMTTAAYEEAVKTAQDEGLTLKEVLLRQNIESELRAREAYLAVEEAIGARSRE